MTVALQRTRTVEILGLATLFLLFTRVSDLYRPREWPLSLNQVMVALVMVFLVVLRRRLVLDRGLAWMLVYGGATGVSSILAVDHLAPLAAMMAYLHDVVIVVALLNLATSWMGFRAVTWTLITAGAAAAAISLVHAISGSELGGLSSADYGNLAGDTVGYRLAGTIGNSNAFAQLLVCVVPLALYRAFGETGWRLRLAGLFATALMTSVIVWTYSRGGALGLIAVLAATLVFRHFRRSVVLRIAIVLVAALVLAPGPYWDRLSVTEQYLLGNSSPPAVAEIASESSPASSSDGTTSAQAPAVEVPAAADRSPTAAPTAVDTGSLPEHTTLWRVGMLMFLEHPLTGIGKGDYRVMYAQYAGRVDPALLAEPKNAHSTPVQILADTGLLGLAAFGALLAVVIAGLRSAKRMCERAGARHEMLLLEPVEIAIYGYLVTSLTMSDDYPRFLWMLLGLAMAGRQVVQRYGMFSARGA